MMARNGVPLWVIAKILGNTTAMIEKVYAEVATARHATGGRHDFVARTGGVSS